MFKKWFNRIKAKEELDNEPTLLTEDAEEIIDAIEAFEKSNEIRLNYVEIQKREYREYVNNKFKMLISEIKKQIEIGSFDCGIMIFPISKEYVEDNMKYSEEVIEELIKERLMFKGYKVDYFFRDNIFFDKGYVVRVGWNNEICEDKKI